MLMKMLLCLQIIYKETKEPSIPKLSPTTRTASSAQEARTTAQTEAATAPQVRPTAARHRGEF